MLRLDDFTANVAKSGLVPPEVVARVRAELAAGPADDAAVRLARRLIQDRLAHDLSRPGSSSRARPAASSWAVIASSAPWAKGAWARSTWP